MCKPVRRTGVDAPREKKERTGKVLPSWRSMRSLSVKETADGLRSGSFASNSETTTRECSYLPRVSRTIGVCFCRVARPHHRIDCEQVLRKCSPNYLRSFQKLLIAAACVSYTSNTVNNLVNCITS